jgi:hypothetical protein
VKWFKHYSDALDDPFVQGLMDEFEHQGYVAWFGLIEIVSKENGKNLTGKLSISPQYLRRKFRVSPSKLRQIYHYCATFGKLSVNFSEKKWEFDFPKVLELKDNYTKDLQVTGKKPSKQTETETETEKEKENRSVKQKETDLLPPASAAAAPAAVSVLTGYGMGMSQASGLIKDYGLEAVNKALASCVKQGDKVRNPGGWITRTLRREWGDRRRQGKVKVPKDLEAIKAEVAKIPQELRPRLRLEARKALGQFACSSLGVVDMKMLELYRVMESATARPEPN